VSITPYLPSDEGALFGESPPRYLDHLIPVLYGEEADTSSVYHSKSPLGSVCLSVGFSSSSLEESSEVLFFEVVFFAQAVEKARASDSTRTIISDTNALRLNFLSGFVMSAPY